MQASGTSELFYFLENVTFLTNDSTTKSVERIKPATLTTLRPLNRNGGGNIIVDTPLWLGLIMLSSIVTVFGLISAIRRKSRKLRQGLKCDGCCVFADFDKRPQPKPVHDQDIHEGQDWNKPKNNNRRMTLVPNVDAYYEATSAAMSAASPSSPASNKDRKSNVKSNDIKSAIAQSASELGFLGNIIQMNNLKSMTSQHISTTSQQPLTTSQPISLTSPSISRKTDATEFVDTCPSDPSNQNACKPTPGTSTYNENTAAVKPNSSPCATETDELTSTSVDCCIREPNAASMQSIGCVLDVEEIQLKETTTKQMNGSEAENDGQTPALLDKSADSSPDESGLHWKSDFRKSEFACAKLNAILFKITDEEFV